jgi:hypothetical protein
VKCHNGIFIPLSMRNCSTNACPIYIVCSSHESTKHPARKEIGRGARSLDGGGVVEGASV